MALSQSPPKVLIGWARSWLQSLQWAGQGEKGPAGGTNGPLERTLRLSGSSLLMPRYLSVRESGLAQASLFGVDPGTGLGENEGNAPLLVHFYSR